MHSKLEDEETCKLYPEILELRTKTHYASQNNCKGKVFTIFHYNMVKKKTLPLYRYFFLSFFESLTLDIQMSSSGTEKYPKFYGSPWNKNRKECGACVEGRLRTCGGEIHHMQTASSDCAEQWRLRYVFMQALKPCGIILLAHEWC